jgi:hypothetical protein
MDAVRINWFNILFNKLPEKLKKKHEMFTSGHLAYLAYFGKIKEAYGIL